MSLCNWVVGTVRTGYSTVFERSPLKWYQNVSFRWFILQWYTCICMYCMYLLIYDPHTWFPSEPQTFEIPNQQESPPAWSKRHTACRVASTRYAGRGVPTLDGGYLPWMGVPTLDGGGGYLPTLNGGTYLGWRVPPPPWLDGRCPPSARR